MSHHHHVELFATSTLFTTVWWSLDVLVKHGPGWELVPPLVGALASLGFAVNAVLTGRQARRHAEERQLLTVGSPKDLKEIGDSISKLRESLHQLRNSVSDEQLKVRVQLADMRTDVNDVKTNVAVVKDHVVEP